MYFTVSLRASATAQQAKAIQVNKQQKILCKSIKINTPNVKKKCIAADSSALICSTNEFHNIINKYGVSEQNSTFFRLPSLFVYHIEVSWCNCPVQIGHVNNEFFIKRRRRGIIYTTKHKMKLIGCGHYTLHYTPYPCSFHRCIIVSVKGN